ncbi:MAG: Calx-beta domain-containing protein [Actinomycetota bacterium]
MNPRRIAVALIVLAGILGGFLWTQRSGDDAATEEEDSAGQVLITRPAEIRTLRDESTVRGVLEREQQSTLNAATEGRVSGLLIDDGDVVEAGDAIVAIDGRTSIAVVGDQSFFRPLDVGSSGRDVLQLETILAEAGFDPGPVDELYTRETRRALAEWQISNGYPGATPEPGETITVSLSPGSAYELGSQNTAAVTIDPAAQPGAAADGGSGGDAPTGIGFGAALIAQATIITLLTPPATANEGTKINYTVASSVPAPAGGFTVAIAYSGTAVAGPDYAVSATTVTIPAGALSASFEVQTVDDNTVESDPVLTVTIGADGLTTQPADIGAPNSGSTTIVDDDVPELSISVNPTAVLEGATATATITASSAPLTDISVNIGAGLLAPTGDATPGTDFETLPTVVTLPAGSTTTTFPVVTLTDTVTEDVEDALIGIQAGSGYTVGAVDSAVLLINDDGLGTIPTITVTTSGQEQNEGAAIVFTIEADTSSIDDLDVTFLLAGSTTAGRDYEVPDDFIATLPAGAEAVNVVITTLNDDDVELDESLALSVSPGAGYNVGVPSSASATLLDDDLPELSITGGGRVIEGSPGVVSLTLDQPAIRDVSVSLSVGGSATLNQDYEAPQTVVTIGAGQSGIAVVFPTLTDQILEPDETVTISFGGNTYYTPGPESTAEITIVDARGEIGPRLSITSTSATVTEGASVTFTIAANPSSAQALPFRAQLGGTATEDVDFVFTEEALLLSPNATRLDLTIPIRQDDVIEADETITLTLIPQTGYGLGDPVSASVTIVDDDVPEVSLRGGNIVLAEGDGAAFVIEADQAVPQDTSINYTVSGTASVGVDFEALSGTAVMAAGTRTVTVPIVVLSDDVRFEPSDMIVGEWPARVGTVSVEEGELVVVGTPLLEITDQEFTIKLIANPTEFSELSVGQRVEVELQASDTIYGGSIGELDETPTINDAGVESYEGRVEVAGELPRVDGANVSITVLVEEAIDVVAVPVQAVLQGANGDEVRVVDPDTGQVTRVPVETGLGEDSWLEITSGLEAGQIVLVEVRS